MQTPVFLITPYDPQAGDDSPHDDAYGSIALPIDATDYAAALRRAWPTLRFVDADGWSLAWELAPQGMRGRLWHTGHAVELTPAGTSVAVFVRWHRRYVSSLQTLYLVRPPERARIEITAATPEEEIDGWIDWSSAMFYRFHAAT